MADDESVEPEEPVALGYSFDFDEDVPSTTGFPYMDMGGVDPRQSFHLYNGGVEIMMDSDGSVVFRAPDHRSDRTDEPLRLKPNGEFVVHGKLVATNLDVYRGFIEWWNGFITDGLV